MAVHTPDPLAPWQYQSFEPFGNKLHQSAPSQMIGLITHWTDRGFTGHEGVDKAGIIHMNGRIYDPVMGCFLQADPFIQEPDNTQSLNRYSYVINNPLSYTDPSGYFFSRLVSQIWRPLANIVGCAAGTAAAQPYLCGATVAATGLVDGQSVLSSLRDGLIAGVQAVVFNQIGIAYNDVAGKEGIAAFLHGAVGAASSALQGGDPVTGFLSSSVTKGISLATKDYLESLNNIFLEAVIVGAVGGSISTLTGGKFANGAVTSALGYAYGEMSRRVKPTDKPSISGSDKVALVGGAADNTFGAHVVLDKYETYTLLSGADSARYFEWTDIDALSDYIVENQGRVTVVAHSYGADGAAHLIASGVQTYRLVTVDPVGWTRPVMQSVANNVVVWDNYYSIDRVGNSWNNLVALIGGAWGALPEGYAQNNVPSGLNHVAICEVYCSP